MRRTPDPPQLTVANQIAIELTSRIVDGRYAPGTSLREVPLAAEFGVSRSSIREALRILERDGVARIQAHRGAAVTQLDTDELIETYQVRSVLLGLVMVLACEHCIETDIEWLIAKCAEMQAAQSFVDSAAGAAHAQISAQMALRLMHIAGNSRAEQMLTQMSAQIARYTRLGLSAPQRRTQSLETWTALVNALKKRDAERAEQLGRRLVTDTLRFALGRIAGLPAGSLG
jgi:DNA-binding GntR family transcriptional regulator